MKRKWKYLSERKSGDYRYVRDFPTSLLRTFPDHPKQFSKELHLNSSCTDSELHRAMDEASRQYDLRVKTALNSDPNAFSESERKLEYMKAHRNAYSERMTEAQERQLERRLTRLYELR